jgi:hypothetical protein
MYTKGTIAFLTVSLLFLLIFYCKAEDEENYRTRSSEPNTNDKQRQKAKLKMRQEAVRKTIKAGSTDECDLLSNPMSVIKGEVCGSYYKVLGLNRNDPLLDKSTVKKAYRQLSLVLHPDKNPSENAETAFKILQEAYECLSDDVCKESYDKHLLVTEVEIQTGRSLLKQKIISAFYDNFQMAYIKISTLANYVYQAGMNVWDWAGDFQIYLLEDYWPVGRPLLLFGLLWKGRFLLQLYGLAYVIVRLNYEIAKSKGLV